jgi:nickel-type superoxide dismutase maturation protease
VPRLLTPTLPGLLALWSPPAGSPVLALTNRSPARRSLALALTLVAAAILRRRVRHMVVAGNSMRPTLQPGDRLITVRTTARPRVGHLAVAPDPRAPERLLIKRVHAITGGLVELRGDATFASTDSRTFGAVPMQTVERCVAFRYYPPERAGRVR